MQKVSFIIPLFNHVAHSQAMLESLRATIPAGLAYEIILIDDFSTDGTRAWLATLNDPHIKTLLHPRKPVYAKTNNRASQWGINIQYAVQPSPDGLPQAFAIGADFIGNLN